MQQALQMHHAGRLTEAQTLYQRVLALHPAHLPALQMLGVLMFQMLTGELPFRGSGPLSVALAHLEARIPRLPAQHRA